MRAAYAKDKELLEQDGESQSGDSFIYEQAKLLAHSRLDDEDQDFSAREIEELLAFEGKDPVKRIALKLICADQLRNGELLPNLQEWLASYLERETPISVEKGPSPKRRNETEIQAYKIGASCKIAEASGFSA